jgi:hypothetical protein
MTMKHKREVKAIDPYGVKERSIIWILEFTLII